MSFYFVGRTGIVMGRPPAPVARVQGVLNRYPRVIDPRTGRHILFPSGVRNLIAKEERAVWNKLERGKFIKEWYDRGYQTPVGGWSKYDIHHILPVEYGGTNNFWNLVPVERETHKLLNAFWEGFHGL